VFAVDWTRIGPVHPTDGNGMTKMALGFTISGADLPALATAIARHPKYAGRPPDRLRVDGKERPAEPDWIAAIAETNVRMVAEWGPIGGHLLTYMPSMSVSGRIPDVFASAASMVELLAPWPFELATFTAIDDEWWRDY
jgi:hypothetical protein